MSQELKIADEVVQWFVSELYDALTAEELHGLLAGGSLDQATQFAALRAASALGYCRMFGADLGGEDGVLPAPVALAAVQGLITVVDRLIQDAEALPNQWDSTDEQVERDELCLALLEARMDAQAAYIAIEESLLEAQCQEAISWQQYTECTEALMAKLDQLDRALTRPEVLETLSTVADLPLLSNWKAMLSGEYKYAQFWWLSGLLEEVAQRVEEEVLRSLPQKILRPKILRAEQRAEVAKLLLLSRFFEEKVFAPRIAAAGEPQIVQLRWVSPNGRYEAVCSLHISDKFPEKITLYFLSTTGERATDLINAPASLAGIVRQISQGGSASFETEKLREALQARQFPELLVGTERQAWHLDQDSLQFLERLVESPDAESDTGTASA